MAETTRIFGHVLWRETDKSEPAFAFGELTVTDDGKVSFRKEDLESARKEIAGGDAVEAAGSRLPSWLSLPRPESTFIVPGFVDLHCHLAVGPNGPLDGEGITENAWKEIRAGVLAIREPGSPKKVAESLLPFERPIIVRAGRHIALKKRYIRGMAVELEAADGEGITEDDVTEALVAEVKRQADEGDGWVKLVGDWIDRSKGEESDLDPLWSRSQLEAAVEAAAEKNAKVAVHTFSSAAVGDVIAAKVGSIEHGSGMNAADMALAADSNIPVVPTVLQVCKFPEFADAATRYPAYAKTMRDLFENRHEWFEDLLASGISILPGSDAGGFQEHGALLEELNRWVEWGMPVSRVLGAATWQARDFLGLSSLSEGAPADAIIFDADPSVDAGVWASPVAVIANGHLVNPRP